MVWNKKFALRVFSLVALLLAVTTWPVLAFQGKVGGSPYAADLLVSGLNTGHLDPGQEYWYAYSRLDLGDSAYNTVILSLNFTAEGVAVANRVNLQVFNFNQVDAWLKDNSGPVDSLGLGTPASADFDVNTGERLWSGPVGNTDVYYVRIFNLSPSPVQFRLTALGQKNTAFDGFMTMDSSTAAARPSKAIPAAVNVPAAANAPVQPTVVAGKPALATAAMPVNPAPGTATSTNWLLAAQAIQGLPPQEAAAWLMSAATLGWLPNTGPAAAPAAMPVNPNPSAPAANKPVQPAGSAESQPPAVAANPAETVTEPKPDPNSGESIYPNRSLQLLDGPNTGRLAPNAEHWYTFSIGKLDGKQVENYSLTMFFTPGEPNLARYVTFEMFTGSQYPIWTRGTPDQMEHFGVGSWVSRDGDYMTGERLWHGTVVNGDRYYVKIVNKTDQWIDYHLVPGDIINTELGEPTVKPAKSVAAKPIEPTGKDIGAPLVAHQGSNSGKLPAGQEIWFSFTTPNTNSARFDFLPYQMELIHKPGYSFLANQVNVELYPYQMQQLWRRGDGDRLKPLGVGSLAEFNEAADTHTRLWDGHLVSNTTYFVRVSNGSAQEIDYNLLIRSH